MVACVAVFAVGEGDLDHSSGANGRAEIFAGVAVYSRGSSSSEDCVGGGVGRRVDDGSDAGNAAEGSGESVRGDSDCEGGEFFADSRENGRCRDHSGEKADRVSCREKMLELATEKS